MRRLLVLALLVAAPVSTLGADAAAVFVGLGDLAGGAFYSRATAVSADGSVVVGESTSGSGQQAFRWTQGGGMGGLGTLSAESSSRAFGVSANGSVVVGTDRAFGDDRAFRWTQAAGMTATPPTKDFARAVSADGSAVAGVGSNGAFLWTEAGGSDDLGDLPGGSLLSDAVAVSSDGSTVVGYSSSSTLNYEAFRWTSADGIVGLGAFGASCCRASQANGVSADGSIVVGYSNSEGGVAQAFRWTQAEGLVLLDSNHPPTGYSMASGISGDASVVVGERDYGVEQPNTSSGEAFVWTSSGGMRGLRDVLVNDYGLDLTGWTLNQAFAVSADGRTIVGQGFNPSGDVEGWMATLPPATCGDGLTAPDEECDDANTQSGDGCSTLCTLEICGNRRIDSGEQCDDGNSDPADGCSASCQLEICGNQAPDPDEACDDGNLTSGDGCDANCVPTGCGNGIVTNGEQCDDGNDVAGDGCDPNCTATGCGNNVLTPPEQCDDGNAASGDGCDIDCTPSTCGNGVAAAGEQCDDANTSSGDGCDANCTPTACGNDITTLGEECDDGNAVSGDGCDADCSVSRCGNEIVAGDEECDDGNNVSGDGCDADCTLMACGNAIKTSGEACDDGNVIDDDGCDTNCQVNYGRQTATQIKCILNVNKAVARVARTQAKANQRCMENAASGLDDCLEADSKGKVNRAKQDFQKVERNKCLATEPPELALGSDRLSGSPAASHLPVQLVHDLLGDPATAEPKGDGKAAKCQTQVLKQANRLFDVIWDEIRDAKADALEGRGTDAVVNDAELSAYIEQMLDSSRSITKATDKLYKRVQDACAQVDNLLTISGCAVGGASAVADCANRAARCRACQLLVEADSRLEMGCDAFDDRVVDLSCAAQ